MITLKHITKNDIEKLNNSSYGNMSSDKKIEMISASESGVCNGKFFKFLLVEAQDVAVGFINVCAHSESVVSIAPEIKEDYRRKGYAKAAMIKAIEYAKTLGYKIAYAGIREDNGASIRLQESLGFEYVQDFFSSRGNKLKLYVKSL